MYDYNYADCINAGNLECTNTRLNPSTVPCQNYRYSKGEYGNTVVREVSSLSTETLYGDKFYKGNGTCNELHTCI